MIRPKDGVSMAFTDGTQTDAAEKHAELLEDALFQVKRVIVGQDRMVERTLVCLLARGHCLIEGVPGLAKTLTVSTLAEVVGGSFARIQFTPDLVPADIVGTRIWRPSREEFDIEWGPVFANLVLADEINRAPAKVQSALLEVMAERQVSIGGRHRTAAEAVPRARHAEPDRVRGRVRAARGAARPLPHADRRAPAVVRRGDRDRAPHGRRRRPRPTQVLTTEQLLALQAVADEVFVHHAVLDYAVRLVMATREPEAGGLPDIAPHIALGRQPPRDARPDRRRPRARRVARPRASSCPQDVFDVAPEILRHRLMLSYDALADGVTTDDVVQQVLSTVPAPSVTPRQDDAARPRRRPPARAGSRKRRDRAAPRASEGVASVSSKAAQLRRLELEVTLRLDGLLRGDFLGLRARARDRRPPVRASYDVGDDARRIDWNLTARSLTPQVRTTEADRELHTWLVVDRSPSMDFGTALCEKRDVAFSAAAAFGFLTARHGNRFGMLVAGGDRVTRIGPSTTRAGAAGLAVAALRR